MSEPGLFGLIELWDFSIMEIKEIMKIPKIMVQTMSDKLKT